MTSSETFDPIEIYQNIAQVLVTIIDPNKFIGPAGRACSLIKDITFFSKVYRIRLSSAVLSFLLCLFYTT